MEMERIKEHVNGWYHSYSGEIYQYIYYMTGDHDYALMQCTIRS
ncbi:hypothetical protein [Alteribacter lacisalsi]|nr:hypothetical protein [Alteribacter lacisalsi]